MVKPRVQILLILLPVLAAGERCFCEEAPIYDKIVVTSRKGPSGLFFQKGLYSAQVFNSSDLEEVTLNSLADIFNGAAGLDLRTRGTNGIQGDFSLRGSTFEQVGLFLDGLPMNDPQTGHHNLDIPLTRFDLERVEVVKEGVALPYGNNSLAGLVLMTTKKPLGKKLFVDGSFGEHALSGNGFSLSLPFQELSTRVSFERKSAKAAVPNTDFDYKTGSLYLMRDQQGSLWDALWGYQEKDFGADSFYSNLYPEEEEHTRTFFFRTGLESLCGRGRLKNNIYMRRHWDKFILNRNNPTFVNYHTTYSYGGGSEFSLPLEKADLLLGVDTGRDQIRSTNMGKHARQYGGFSLGVAGDPQERLAVDARARFQGYEDWGFQGSYNLALGYYLVDNKLRVLTSAGRSFRIPSFTELYYSDPANHGNPQLDIEQSDNFRAGLSFEENAISVGLEGFLRRGRNLIDWARVIATDPWQATNLGKVDYFGGELTCKIGRQISFSYVYTDADKKAEGFFSKYALDVLQHQCILGLDFAVKGLNLNWNLSYNQRRFGETYFVGNFALSKRIIRGDFIFEPFVKIDNFSDTSYSEVGGVLQPGRWVQGGVRFEW